MAALLYRAAWRFVADHRHEPIVLAQGSVCRHCGRPMTSTPVVLEFRKAS